jgi:phytoene/squalene synthetase
MSQTAAVLKLRRLHPLWAGVACPGYAIPDCAPSLPRRKNTAAAWLAPITKTFAWQRGSCPRSFARTFLDDLGDEVGDATASLALLDEWQAELDACYDGHPRHPVFVALAETVRNLIFRSTNSPTCLLAFRQDQTVTRYPTFEDVLGYCKNSANPVGHLVSVSVRLSRRRAPAAFRLHLHRAAAGELLAGRCSRLRKGRIYLPLESLAKFGVMESDIASAGRRRSSAR